ncbi:Cystatin domain [Dillenia turbinata]|uniref:Cystatin domain n=1 Tax=Dillenia turbinata TaxID=194707 RepID=A0AAN8WD43_9MAGN
MGRVQILALLLVSFVLLHGVSAGVLLNVKPVDPEDPHVLEIAKFAVNEAEREEKTNYEFKYVSDGISGDTSDGRRFQLLLKVVADKHGEKKAAATVLEKGELASKRELKETVRK